MTENKLTTVFDTIIQKKDKIDTAATVDLALTELLMAIKDLRGCSNVESINTDQDKLIKYGEFLINLASDFDFSKEKHKEEIISNSLLPTGLPDTALEDPEAKEINKKISPYQGKPGMLKIFKYKLIYVSPLVWLAFGGTFEEWLERAFTRYDYFALFIKLNKVISDYYDLLNKKLNITIPSEDRIHCPKWFLFHSTKIIHYISIPLGLIYNNEVNCSIEEYCNKVTSLLNYGVNLGFSANSITEIRSLIEEMFGLSESVGRYIRP